jgi:hypothetical protein
MQGEDTDHGTAAFHSTELVGLILTGGEARVATPELFGPRNAGQVEGAARTSQAAAMKLTQSKVFVFMSCSFQINKNS